MKMRFQSKLVKWGMQSSLMLATCYLRILHNLLSCARGLSLCFEQTAIESSVCLLTPLEEPQPTWLVLAWNRGVSSYEIGHFRLGQTRKLQDV